MALKDLEIEHIGGMWICTYLSEGNTVVELEREENGDVAVLASIGGMNEVPVLANYRNPYSPSVILQLNLPSDVFVTIQSQTEVVFAKTLTEE